MKINKKSLIFTSVILFFVIIVLLVFLSTLPASSKRNAITRKVEVPTGTTVKSVSKTLKSQKLIKSGFVFYLCGRYNFVKAVLTFDSEPLSLKSGVYTISSDMSVSKIMKILSSGQQEYIRVSIPEGLTITKVGQRLQEASVCSLEDFKEACKDPDLLLEFGIKNESFEGYLFPDTYFFTPMMKGEAVVRQMASNFFEKIKTVPGLSEKKWNDMNYTVTLASIVEREYRIPSEAPLIASVFTNRLNHNIGLYSCATIEYIITEIQGRPHPDVITYEDLAINSPYNTYKWAGLPPSPISNPGLTALNAAQNPANTNYYFFRLVDAEKGKHVFTKDFNTHVNEGSLINTSKK